MSSLTIALIGFVIHSMWSSIWIILYNSTDNEWMYVVAGGPVLWIWYGFVCLVRWLIKQYRNFMWQAVVEDTNGNKFRCKSEQLNEILEKYDVQPAFEFAKNTNFKPYRPNDCIMASNPRYIHRSVACQFPYIKEINHRT